MKRWMGPLIALAVFAMVAVPALWWRRGPGNTTPGTPPASVDGGSGLPPEPAVLLAEYRPGNDFDPGTVRVFLANPGPAPVAIQSVRLDGFPLPVWGLPDGHAAPAGSGDIPLGETHGAATGGADGENPAAASAPSAEPDLVSSSNATPAKEPESTPDAATADTAPSSSAAGRWMEHWAYWAKVTDAAIPPGGLAEFSAKPRHTLSRPVKLEFEVESGPRLSALVSPAVPPALRVESVAFAGDRRAMYVYVRNIGPAPLPWRGVSLAEKPGVRPGWQSGAELASGQYGLAILPLANVEPGDFLTGVRIA